MSDEIRHVKISAADIDAVRGQLETLHNNLEGGQQAVLEWLLQRAAEAPADEEVAGYFLSGPFITPTQSFNLNTSHGFSFNQSLGLARFNSGFGSHADAGSSVGITGTVMF